MQFNEKISLGETFNSLKQWVGELIAEADRWMADRYGDE